MPTFATSVEGWPALMSTEMAARFISVDEVLFLRLVSTFDIPCVQIEGLSARWRKQELERLIKRLPSASAKHMSDPDKRLFRLDHAQVDAIADAVARKIERRVAVPESKLVSIGEATAIMGVGRSTIYKMITEGALETRRIGRRTLIPRSALDGILNGREDS